MKTHIENPFLLPVLIAGLGLVPEGRATAQSFTNLHTFSAYYSPFYTNYDGVHPQGALISSDSILYGTTSEGGGSGHGTVFAVNTDGTGFTNLHIFTATTASTNTDGVGPNGGLILSGNALYGTASQGGSFGNGAVFKINTDGTSFANLHSFTTATAGTNSDGVNPQNSLVLSGNTLYGTAPYGGSSSYGTVFAVNTDGTGFANLYNFTATSHPGWADGTNSDGAWPHARLILSGNTLYGTANQGGSSGNGTLFAINTNGKGFTNLHHFTAMTNDTNWDGAFPYGGLILSGNTLYGTAYGGGSSGMGTVFAVTTNGTGFTNLYNFTAVSGSRATNSDGGFPLAPLIISGDTLYGMAQYGGSAGSGTVFALNTNGSGFMTLYSFSAFGAPNYTNGDGAWPQFGLILADNILYGSAWTGGNSGNGTVFSLSLPPPPAPALTLIPYGANVILTWPADAAGFMLQSTTNLVSPSVWSIVSPGPVLIGGQNVVFNPITGPRKFYRLRQ